VSAPTNRQPHIQGLRAVAVLVVVLFHAGLPVPGGFIGVDVFFVISGYVITAMLQRELADSGRVDFVRFYIRRFKRLTPALALTVVTTCVLSALVLSPLGPQQRAGESAVGAMLLAANWVISSTTGGYFDASAELNPLLNIWSLSVEEQFYLGFPLLMFLAWTWARRRGTTVHVTAAVALVGTGSFALAVYGSQSLSTGQFATGFYSPFTRAWEFAAGALLALAPAPRWTREGASVLSVIGAGMLLFSLWEIEATTPFPGPWTLLPVIASLFLISAAGATDAPITRATGSLRVNMIGTLLASRPMVRLGDWSYSIYLWHWPFIVLAVVAWPTLPGVRLLAACASVLPALLSYRFLEQPIRTRDLRPRALVVLVALTLTLPLAAGFGVQWLADNVWKPKVQQTVQPASARAMHAGYVQGCHYEPGDGPRDPKPCVWHPEQSRPPVYLLGDSNAAQFIEALIDATEGSARPLIVTTTSGCPVLDIRMDGPAFPGYGPSCLARNQRLLAWMAEQTPGTVVLGASNDYWYETGWSLTLPDGSTISDHDRMLNAVRASLTRVVKALEAAGHRVLLVQTIPHWNGIHAWDPLACSLSSSLSGCVQRMPADYDLDRTAAARKLVRSVAEATDASVLDVTAQVCPRGECVTATKSMPIYRDSTHLTVAMSHALAPQFEAALTTR